MLTVGQHFHTLDTTKMSQQKSSFSVTELQTLLASITHAGVLRQLTAYPFRTLILYSNMGAAPGEYLTGDIIINTHSRSYGEVDATHKYAQNDDEYYKIVLLHEIGHALDHVMRGKNANDYNELYKIFNQAKGVTEYAINRGGLGPRFSEYVAETFTAAIALPNLHIKDQEGIKIMNSILSTW